MKTIAIISTLHDRPVPDCATRNFRNEPVLSWTLRRIRMCPQISASAVLCWEDQAPAVQPIASAGGAFVLAKGPRCPLPMVEAIAAARTWSDGWRGGLVGACHFDVGFHGPWMLEIARTLEGEAAVLVEADAGLVDPNLLAQLIEHARSHPQIEFAFTPAAPGLNGVLLRASAIEQLSAAGGWPGRLVCYWPDLPGRDPVAKDECAPVPTAAARTLHRFTLDSSRQVSRLERCTLSLNGTLVRSSAEELVARMSQLEDIDPLPRDVSLELNTDRATRPVFSPVGAVTREPMPPQLAARCFAELSVMDDIRLTLGGVGDPLLHPNIFEIIEAAARAQIRAIHIETDLVRLPPGAIERLLESPIGVLSVNLPATCPETYQAMMGIDAYSDAIANIRDLVLSRNKAARGRPIVVPTFHKCRQNVHEMEAWYDHWLRAVGSAVIVGPSDYCGRIADPAVADMCPPKRVPCRRLRSRLSILCDGRVVPCEQDVAGEQSLGQIGRQSLTDTWRESMARLREDHAAARWHAHPLCDRCREWHRP